MSQYLSTDVAHSLYWFGRNLERIEQSLLEIEKAYDQIIDVDKTQGKALFSKLGIDLEYGSASEFLQEALFGDHANNIDTLMGFVRENCIIARSCIEMQAFGSVIELKHMIEQHSHNTFKIDYRFLDDVLSLINEIWGSLTQSQSRELSDYFIRLGKLVEKADLHLRFDHDNALVLIILEEITTIVEILAPGSSFSTYSLETSADTLLTSVNSQIGKILVEQ